MTHTEKNQITCNNDQNRSCNKQIYIDFHNLLPSFINNKNYYQEYTTDNSRKEISVYDVPFNHDFSPFSVSINETVKNTPVINSEKPKVAINSSKLLGRTSTGEITPAENQATVMLALMSDSFSNWLAENLIIRNNDSTRVKANQAENLMLAQRRQRKCQEKVSRLISV